MINEVISHFAPRRRYLLAIMAMILTFILPDGLPGAETRKTLPELLIKTLRAYEANRPAEAQEFWRQARALDPRIARPPWLPSENKSLSGSSVMPTAGNDNDLWGIFFRLLALPLLLLLLIWQSWKAASEIKEDLQSRSKKSSPQPSCPECIRLAKDYHDLQRKFEILQKSVAGRVNE